MTKEELKFLASEVAKNEIIIKYSKDKVEKDKAADRIEAIVNNLNTLDDILELDIAVHEFLEQNLDFIKNF